MAHLSAYKHYLDKIADATEATDATEACVMRVPMLMGDSHAHHKDSPLPL